MRPTRWAQDDPRCSQVSPIARPLDLPLLPPSPPLPAPPDQPLSPRPSLTRYRGCLHHPTSRIMG